MILGSLLKDVLQEYGGILKNDAFIYHMQNKVP